MKEAKVILNPNLLVQFIQKQPSEFTKDDIIRFVEFNEIKSINFRYIAEDGRLKTLNFVINSKNHLEDILSFGERVDGSSLFSFMEAGASDLYVIPKYKTAFINPFSETPALEILCAFYNCEGKPLDSSPDYILRKANSLLQKQTGCNFKVLGELEYYVNSKAESIFPASDQKGYHESEPFAKFESMRKEALQLIAQCGCQVKYGHSEVGNFCNNQEAFEQHEIEFLPCPPDEAADQLVIAKWVLRMLAEKQQVEISFAPKITVGKAGSGLHFHMLLEKDGKNIMLENNQLSNIAKKAISGILDFSAALTAFGNTIPSSYLRLVPHQEAPTNICWGYRNRSALVRVPLGWTTQANMIAHANNQPEQRPISSRQKQTIEFRAPDGSAQIHLTIAGLILACLHGLKDEKALEKAKTLYVDGNIFSNSEQKSNLKQLPASCYESAVALENMRSLFEKDNVFPSSVIDHTVAKLKSYNDENLSERLYGKNDELRELILRFIHCQ